jgi:hypothetical protein
MSVRETSRQVFAPTCLLALAIAAGCGRIGYDDLLPLDAGVDAHLVDAGRADRSTARDSPGAARDTSQTSTPDAGTDRDGATHDSGAPDVHTVVHDSGPTDAHAPSEDATVDAPMEAMPPCIFDAAGTVTCEGQCKTLHMISGLGTFPGNTCDDSAGPFNASTCGALGQRQQVYFYMLPDPNVTFDITAGFVLDAFTSACDSAFFTHCIDGSSSLASQVGAPLYLVVQSTASGCGPYTITITSP